MGDKGVLLASTSTPTGLPETTWQPNSDAEREAVLQQLNRVFNSPMFRGSKRYPALLKFIVEQTLEGRGDSIKERVLGIEVFGRAPDYDTNSDHVVRSAAGEVRKRLAQYYMAEGREETIRIEVPPGSYVAQFRLAPETTILQQIPPMAPREVFEEVPSSQPWWRARPALLISWFLSAALAIALITGGKLTFGGRSTLQKFWDPIFAESGPVLICVGIKNVPEGRAGTDPLWRRVSVAELLTVAKVTSYAGERHSSFRILGPPATTFSDLHNAPSVLIGVGDNSWSKELNSRLRFAFLLNDTGYPLGIADTKDPNGKSWKPSRNSATDSLTDYAIVSRLIDPRVEQTVVTIGGMGPHGTEAAGEFATNPDQIKKLNAYISGGWEKKNLQVVLSTEIVKGSSGPPKIEAVYFW